MTDKHCRIGLLYLDPILGGICGTSLTRFHIRMYPDPLTESLTFWKAVSEGTYDYNLKKLCASFGKPRLCNYNTDHFAKLLEDPNSINVPKGLSAQNLIKGEYKAALQKRPDLVKHEIIKCALSFSGAQEGSFIRYLAGIKPCFPRFLSEFRSATYFGLTDSIIGLFQNSKTIRNLFKNRFRDQVDNAILQCELGSLNLLSTTIQRHASMWKCSASQADYLREQSCQQFNVLSNQLIPQ